MSSSLCAILLAMLSLVMPVYNTPEYLLDRAIKSVLKQSSDDVELVIIDDGSRIETARFLDGYASDRVKVIHQKNMGLSLARKTGIDNATGEYIGFIDGDDYLEHEFAEIMVRSLRRTHSDAVDCSFYVNHNEDKSKPNLFRGTGRLLNKYQACKMLLGDVFMRGFVWCKVFKAEILKEKSKFDFASVHYFEDMPMCFGALSVCTRVAYLQKPLYHYYKSNDGSLTNTLDPNRARHHLESFLLIGKMAKESGDAKLTKIVRKSYLRCKVSISYDIKLSLKAGLSKEEAKRILEELKSLKHI